MGTIGANLERRDLVNGESIHVNWEYDRAIPYNWGIETGYTNPIMAVELKRGDETLDRVTVPAFIPYSTFLRTENGRAVYRHSLNVDECGHNNSGRMGGSRVMSFSRLRALLREISDVTSFQKFSEEVRTALQEYSINRRGSPAIKQHILSGAPIEVVLPALGLNK